MKIVQLPRLEYGIRQAALPDTFRVTIPLSKGIHSVISEVLCKILLRSKARIASFPSAVGKVRNRSLLVGIQGFFGAFDTMTREFGKEYLLLEGETSLMVTDRLML